MRITVAVLVVATGLFAAPAGRTQEPPPPRPQAKIGVDIEDLFARSDVSGEFGAVLFRLDNGKVVDIHAGDKVFPPASTVKILAAARALKVLGPKSRFTTRLVTDGVLRENGVLEGDLVLLGGGDPTLDNNDLARMADSLRERGVTEVRGRFLFDDRALPGGDRIDPGQREHIASNTGYGGLNLNFNRTRLYGAYDGNGTLQGRLSAYADGLEVEVDTVHVVVFPDAGTPTAEYRSGRDGEYWIIEERVLAQAPWIWLPVRDPGPYAASVFRAIAAGKGLLLPRPERGRAPIEATALVEHDSESMARIAAEMLFYSNNLSAEILSLAAAGGDSLPAEDLETVAQMHVKALLGEADGSGIHLLNLSGLSDRSRVSPLAFREILLRVLNPLRPPESDIRFVVPLYDLRAAEAGLRDTAVVQAKSGTLHFVRALAGYLHGSSCGRDFGFAIFIADIDRREALRDELDIPVASLTSQAPRLWRQQAQELERDILVHWIQSLGCG